MEHVTNRDQLFANYVAQLIYEMKCKMPLSAVLGHFLNAFTLPASFYNIATK